MTTSNELNRYAHYLDEHILKAIDQKAKILAGLRILHINTTLEGGGVAELLETVIPIADELGIHHERKIVQLDASSNRFTDRLVELLQGNEPGTIDEEDKRIFLDMLGSVLTGEEETRADIYVIHDFQLAPLASLYPWMRSALWFSHIDTADPNPNAVHYVLQFLGDYDLCVFNSQHSILDGLKPEQARAITLGIDPFRRKNDFLSREKGMDILSACGVDPARPLITQVSRFGGFKNPWQAIDVYRIVKERIPTVQLAFVGALEADDDPGAVNILRDLQNYAGNDPDIHFLYDPKMIQDDEVNAFQRYSSVILQRSTREGFGLTVTEAMWKYQPVVGTSATGLRTQITDKVNGYIADSTDECAERTLYLLEHREVWEKMGAQAHEHVRQNYLIPSMMLDYLEALVEVYQKRSSDDGRRVV